MPVELHHVRGVEAGAAPILDGDERVAGEAVDEDRGVVALLLHAGDDLPGRVRRVVGAHDREPVVPPAVGQPQRGGLGEAQAVRLERDGEADAVGEGGGLGPALEVGDDRGGDLDVLGQGTGRDLQRGAFTELDLAAFGAHDQSLAVVDHRGVVPTTGLGVRGVLAAGEQQEQRREEQGGAAHGRARVMGRAVYLDQARSSQIRAVNGRARRHRVPPAPARGSGRGDRIRPPVGPVPDVRGQQPRKIPQLSLRDPVGETGFEPAT